MIGQLTIPRSAIKSFPDFYIYIKIVQRYLCAALAQLVEHRIRNAGVGCSNHPGGTIISITYFSNAGFAVPHINAATDNQRRTCGQPYTGDITKKYKAPKNCTDYL